MGLDPVMLQTFDMVKKRGAKGAARAKIVKRFTREGFRSLLAKPFGVVERRLNIMVKT